MGGIRGLLRIDKNLPVESSEYPQMQLTDILINGESVSDALSANPTGISVSWSSKSIAVRVMSCEKDIFRQKIYRYQIVGLNNQYIDSYSSELVIRSLPPEIIGYGFMQYKRWKLDSFTTGFEFDHITTVVSDVVVYPMLYITCIRCHYSGLSGSLCAVKKTS